MKSLKKGIFSTQKIGYNVKKLAFSGLLLCNLTLGCAGSQENTQIVTGPPKTQKKTDYQEDCVKKSSEIQSCLVDGAVDECRREKECIAEKLEQGESFPGHERELSIVVGKNEEVFSMRVGVEEISILRLHATAVDSDGIEFEFTIERMVVLEEKHQISQDRIRMNFDGSNENVDVLSNLEIWNLRVDDTEEGKAKVSFSTVEDRIFVRNQE
jgi:hypothetical protein